MGDRNRLVDQSADRRYFTIVPQIVWAKARDVYDLALWCTVKMIAGDEGECYVSTEDLATLAMMSTGKASQCRQYLLDAELLEGEIRKDPGYRQAVWHLTIPDLWDENVDWRQELGDDLKARVAWKERQKAEKWEAGKDKRAKERRRKSSLHTVKPSHSEAEPSHSETKENQEGKQTNGGGVTTTEHNQAVEALTAFGVSQSVARELASKRDAKVITDWLAYAGKASGLQNPPAFVVAKLKVGEPAPDGGGEKQAAEGRRRYAEWAE